MKQKEKIKYEEIPELSGELLSHQIRSLNINFPTDLNPKGEQGIGMRGNHSSRLWGWNEEWRKRGGVGGFEEVCSVDFLGCGEGRG